MVLKIDLTLIFLPFLASLGGAQHQAPINYRKITENEKRMPLCTYKMKC